jgi:glyoxylase-like metal-dependent hydrolase (beta-lactamase superfamily II)
MKMRGIRLLPAAAVVLCLAPALPAQAPDGRGAGQGRGDGRGRGAAAAGVQVAANKLAPNFYALQANGLSTIGVLVGPDGVLMVDSGTPALTERIVAAIKTVSDRPIRFLINTHLHPDHTGGNENFGKLGVTILGRERLRGRLVKPNPRPDGTAGTPAPAAALPLVTYDAPLTFHLNGEDVQAIPVPTAHTDGDTMVRFPTSDVIMTGDFYRSAGYPNIDRASGGTFDGMIRGLNAIAELATPNTRIVPGHGAIVDEKAVVAHRDLATALRDRVAALVKKGQTLEQILATKPTAEYDAGVPQAGTTGERFIGQLYAELGGK